MSGSAEPPPKHDEIEREPLKRAVHIAVLCKTEVAALNFFAIFAGEDETENSNWVTGNVFIFDNVTFHLVSDEEDYSMDGTYDCTLLLFSEQDSRYFGKMIEFGRKMMYPMMIVAMDLKQEAADIAAHALISFVHEAAQSLRGSIYSVDDISDVSNALSNFDYRHLPSFNILDKLDREIIRTFISNLYNSPSIANPCKIHEIETRKRQNVDDTAFAQSQPTLLNCYFITVPPKPDISVLRHRIEQGLKGIFVFLAVGCSERDLHAIKILLTTVALEKHARCVDCESVEEAYQLGMNFDRRIWLFTTLLQVVTTYFDAIDHLLALHLPSDDSDTTCPKNLSNFEKMKLRRDKKAKKSSKAVLSSVTGPSTELIDLSSLEDAVVKPPSNRSSKKKIKKNAKTSKNVVPAEEKKDPKQSETETVSSSVGDDKSLETNGNIAKQEGIIDTPKAVTPTLTTTASCFVQHVPAAVVATSQVKVLDKEVLFRYVGNANAPAPIDSCSSQANIENLELMKRQLEILRQAHNRFYFNPDGTPDEKVVKYVPLERRDHPDVYKMPLREYNERFGERMPRYKPKPEEPNDANVNCHAKDSPTLPILKNAAVDAASSPSGDKKAIKQIRPKRK